MKRETEAPRTFPVRGAFSSRGLGRGPNRCGSPPPSRYRWAPWSPPSRPSCGCGWSPRRCCRRRCSPGAAAAGVPPAARGGLGRGLRRGFRGRLRSRFRFRSGLRGRFRGGLGRRLGSGLRIGVRTGTGAVRRIRIVRGAGRVGHIGFFGRIRRIRLIGHVRNIGRVRLVRRAGLSAPLAAGALRRLAARAGLRRARPGHDRLIQVHARLALHQGERSASPPIRWLSRPVPGGTAPRTARRPP